MSLYRTPFSDAIGQSVVPKSGGSGPTSEPNLAGLPQRTNSKDAVPVLYRDTKPGSPPAIPDELFKGKKTVA